MLPEERGIYGLFFRAAPGIAPTKGCYRRDDLPLLYVGTAGANLGKRGTLRKRLGDNHLGGNERRSTICLTLAALLPHIAGPAIAKAEPRGIRCHTSNNGARALRLWMDASILACWTPHVDPSALEATLVYNYHPPLNIDFSAHPFVAELRRSRDDRRARALASWHSIRRL